MDVCEVHVHCIVSDEALSGRVIRTKIDFHKETLKTNKLIGIRKIFMRTNLIK